MIKPKESLDKVICLCCGQGFEENDKPLIFGAAKFKDELDYTRTIILWGNYKIGDTRIATNNWEIKADYYMHINCLLWWVANLSLPIDSEGNALGRKAIRKFYSEFMARGI
jgi:hypothetical protein